MRLKQTHINTFQCARIQRIEKVNFWINEGMYGGTIDFRDRNFM